ncbi:MAG: ATP synthase F0 subunit B [Candidatus Acidiferrales bacterium]|jgi:F-type H+-transporting ATPase subunit b
MRRLARTLGFLAVFLFLAVWPVLAQERDEPPAETPTGYIFRWLNFAIVFFAIAYTAKKWGGPYFRAQADEISGKIAEGARAREAAESQKKEIEKKLGGLDDEIKRIREEGKRDQQAETKRLHDLARSEADKIEHAAQMEIEAAGRAANQELKAHAARLAIERAEALLQKEMTPQAEAGLFRTFVAELERSVN